MITVSPIGANRFSGFTDVEYFPFLVVNREVLLHRAVKLLALLPNRDSRTLNGQDAGLRRFAAPRIEPSHDLCARQTPEEGRRARRGATGGSPAHLKVHSYRGCAHPPTRPHLKRSRL